MKATIDIPEEIYRRVKAKAALEGRAIREVTIELYRVWLGEETLELPVAAPPMESSVVSGAATPSVRKRLAPVHRAGAPAAPATLVHETEVEQGLDHLDTKLL